ncbi:MAG: glycosyltransferase family 4 protein [Thermoplasmata archaeon]|nr:glycosyltransferase family 4 protein [Thermoplasmata archaeon]
MISRLDSAERAAVVRILIVADDVAKVRGGIERHAAELRAELVTASHQVELRAPSSVRRRDIDGADWVVFDGVRRGALFRLLPRSRPETRWALFTHGSFVEEARTAELRASGLWSPGGRFQARRLFDIVWGRRLYRCLDVVFVLSSGEGDDVGRLFGVPPQRLVVSPPFLTAEFRAAAAQPSAPGAGVEPYILSVGRLEPRKNLPTLLAALEGLPLGLVLAGQDRGGLEAVRRKAASVPGVRWRYLGLISEQEKVALMRRAAAVVVPSVVEGVPASALEALALGRPVVLAGVAYGPEGPGVVRCAPSVAGLRESIRAAVLLRPDPREDVPTAASAAQRLIEALSGPAQGSR